MGARTPINDEPDIDINLLPERQRLLKKLVEDIRQCSPPMVFGVHGDWGAGKTSFLQAVMYELTGSCPCAPPSKETKRRTDWLGKNAPVAVWFEAWRYQNESAPIIALLHEMRAQLDGWSKAKEVGGAIWRNFMLAFDSIILKIEAEAGIPGNNVKVGGQFAPFQMNKAREETQKARLSTPLPSNQIRDALDEVFKGLIGAGDKNTPQHRIVIFIDDLDRCSATAMFSLLESIKIYLNLKHCVFVLGINRHELERNIASILPEPVVEDQRQVRAHEYIEKLCGNMIRLPYANPSAVVNMVEKWLEPLDGNIRKKGTTHARNEHSDNRDAILALMGQHNFLPLNPRRIKMWCNTVLQLYENRTAKLPNGEVVAAPIEQIPALVLIACLHTFYPCIHQSLASALSFMDALKKWCVAEQRMEPELDVFDGVKRVFVMPEFITAPSQVEKLTQKAIWSEETGFFSAELQQASRWRALENQSKLISSKKERLDNLQPILKRAYGWSGDMNQTDDKTPEGEAPKRIPLLTDPSSLHYFHPQSLVADENITEDMIRPYLHLD